MISTLASSSSSPDLLHFNHHQHSRLFHLPKSRSQLHHHHHHHHHSHHHQQPSWSSSLSAFSLQRSSAFLIDEYGNEHDPEHCQFKTLAVPSNRRSASSSSSSNPSIASSPSSPSCSSSRSSIRSLGPSQIAQSIATPSSHHPPRPLQLLNRCLSYTPQPHQSTWSTIKSRQQTKINKSSQPSPQDQNYAQQEHPHPSRWSGKIWSHLLRASSASHSHPPASIRSHLPSPTPRSFNPNSPCTHDSNNLAHHTIFKRKRKLSNARTVHHQQAPRLQPYLPHADSPRPHHPHKSSHHHLCGMRRRLELIKLEFRFGILRTRKRFNGVWKK